nr:hypothetical protein [Xenorhabdus bovienii]
MVYNRFRYYSPVASCYLTPDPIGLAGGKIRTGMCIIPRIGSICSG